jgi:nitrogen fixation protein NifU and related proteins
MQVEALYQDIILDHYRAPHGKGLREPYDAEVYHVNPTCGDEVTMRVRLAGANGAAGPADADDAGRAGAADPGRTDAVEADGPRIADVSYDSMGCSISQAAASVLHDLVDGRRVDDAMHVHDEFLALMQSKGQIEPDEDLLEDAIAFAGVSKYPARIKCALLAWMAWKDATLQALSAHSDKTGAAADGGAPATEPRPTTEQQRQAEGSQHQAEEKGAG